MQNPPIKTQIICPSKIQTYKCMCKIMNLWKYEKYLMDRWKHGPNASQPCIAIIDAYVSSCLLALFFYQHVEGRHPEHK